MTLRTARSAGNSRTDSLLAAALLAAFSILVLGLLVVARSTADPAATGGPVMAPSPFWSVTLLAGCALCAAAVAFIALRGGSRSRRNLARLSADAARIALGEYRFPMDGYERTGLEPIATALARLGTLVDAAATIIEDRDRQLATLRTLGGMIYWETGADGRYARLEFEPSLPRRLRLGQLGQAQFERATPLDDAGWQAATAAIGEQRPFGELALRRADADGRGVEVLESGQPRFAPDGTFLGYAGVTRLRNAAAPDRAAEAARTALETSSEAILVVALQDGTPLVRDPNAAAEQLFERPGRELSGAPVNGLFDPAQPGATALLADAIRESRPLRRAMTVVNRFGERIEVLVRLEPLDDGQASTALLVLDPREAELAALRARSHEGLALRREAARQAERLERRTRELEAFAYGVSHDLRAPLRLVEGYAQLLRDDRGGTLDPAGREHLERILTGCARMERMIDATLTLTRTSTQPMIAMPVDLGRIARETLDALARGAPGRRVEVRVGEGLETQGDPTLLRTMMENLLGNAWKYTARCESASIRFDARRDADGNRVFCVEDNGSGFDMRHADRLFGLFQRLHPESEFPGNGIGLATVQRIVQRHGGTIWAESSPGQGSRFYFTLRGPDRPD